MKKYAVFILFALLAASIFSTFRPAIGSGDSWKTLAPMPTPRYGLGLATVNGKIYAIGGQTGDPLHGACLGVNEMYDPVANKWTTMAPMPTARSFFGIAVYQDKICAIGGDIGVSTKNPGRDVTGTNEVYDPATNTWTSKAPMPTPRGYMDAQTVNGKIYVMGGGFLADDYNGIGSEVGNEVYDPATDTWTAKAPIPVGPSNLGMAAYASAVVGDRIYVFGGITALRSWDNLSLAYDTLTDSWSSATPMPVGSRDSYMTASSVITADGRQEIYVFGGQNAAQPNSTMIYAVDSRSWTIGLPLLTTRWAPSSATINNSVYVIGGIANTTLGYGGGIFYYTAYTVTDTNEIYTFPAGTMAASPSPTATSSPTYTPTIEPIQTPSPTQAPTVSILSPQNNSFFNVSIEGVIYQLIYETNTTLSWVSYSIGGNDYSIDGKGSGNVTVSENGTWVRDFGSSGYRTLTLFANDTSGNWASPQTVTYLVNFYPDYPPTPTPSPTQQLTPSPTPSSSQDNSILTIIIAGLAVATVVVGLLVYFIKHNRVKQ